MDETGTQAPDSEDVATHEGTAQDIAAQDGTAQDGAAQDGAAADAPAARPAPTRPDWLESTKHTRRRRPPREPRGERRARNPWVVFAIGAVVVVLVGGVAAVALQRWLDRSLVTVPESVAGLARSTDPEQLAIAAQMRDSELRDPKYSASRFEVVPYSGGLVASFVIFFPAGQIVGDDDLASIAATSSDVEYGAPFTNGDAHCIVGTTSQDTISYCYRTGDAFTVAAITVPDDATATTGARAVQDGYAAQG